MKEIKRYLEKREGEYSFYFEDLKSGYTYGFNEEKKMPAAGCIKVPIAIAVMKEVENGNIPLNELIEIAEDDKATGYFGIISEFTDKKYSIKELIAAMLIQSDNTAACKFIKIIGMNRINDLIREIGLKSTMVKKYPSNIKLEDENENITTSYDLSKALKLLRDGEVLTKENSEFILKALQKHQPTRKIPFYLPKEIQMKVANKIGVLDNLENDMVLVSTEKGDFVFTVMANNLPSNVYGVTTISKSGKMMYDMIDKDWN